MGERDQDRGDAAEPVRAPLTADRAREVTAGLREAMDGVRRSVAALAARVRDAYAARVWVPLGYGSWESYCQAEFGISRAQAYRLLDIARSLTAIHEAVTALAGTSRMRDSGPAAVAALDYGLSQRALIAVSARAQDVAELITRRLATLARTRHARPQRPPGPMRRRCAPWSARPSATSAPPGRHRPPVLRRTRSSPRCAPSSPTLPPAATRWVS
ncbi:hypothetical protein [Streptomyces sp. NRRL S-31]|uniref:hypothetical protein n=1 Tax=Streptomyces sp. NRRL S-31 TaxID=1463898 RepID=UPI000AC27B74|nr:hypothetical protein [Streptomyces sp. NRRL S-31]